MVVTPIRHSCTSNYPFPPTKPNPTLNQLKTTAITKFYLSTFSAHNPILKQRIICYKNMHRKPHPLCSSLTQEQDLINPKLYRFLLTRLPMDNNTAPPIPTASSSLCISWWFINGNSFTSKLLNPIFCLTDSIIFESAGFPTASVT